VEGDSATGAVDGPNETISVGGSVRCGCFRTSCLAAPAEIDVLPVAAAAQQLSAREAGANAGIRSSWPGICCTFEQQSCAGADVVQHARTGTPAKAKPAQSTNIDEILWCMVRNYAYPKQSIDSMRPTQVNIGLIT
jgi:hypothetical protein